MNAVRIKIRQRTQSQGASDVSCTIFCQRNRVRRGSITKVNRWNCFQRNRIDTPPNFSNAFIRAKSPSQLHVLIDSRRRKIYSGCDISVGISGPCQSAPNRISTSVVECGDVTPADKAAARSQNIRERTTVDGNLQNASIELKLHIIAVAELKHRCGRGKDEGGRRENAFTGVACIRNKCVIGT